ncbi:MAG: hypothetical protein V3R65_01575 [Acidiferrobacterales bacterium]
MGKSLLLTTAVSILWLSSVHSAWTLEQQKQAANGADCYIKSSPVSISDGYRDIPVHVEYDGHDLVLVTPSNIDSSFTDTRVLVDWRKPAIIGVVLGQTHVRYPDMDGVLAQQAIKGLYLYTYARFWPTWPATSAQLARISLMGFTRAHKALNVCRK